MKKLLSLSVLFVFCLCVTPVQSSNYTIKSTDDGQRDGLNEKMMSTTTVSIYKNGSRVGKGYKVYLAISGTFNTAHTKVFWTNSDGVAHIEHSAKGKCKVNVNGSYVATGTAPGNIRVDL